MPLMNYSCRTVKQIQFIKLGYVCSPAWPGQQGAQPLTESPAQSGTAL